MSDEIAQQTEATNSATETIDTAPAAVEVETQPAEEATETDWKAEARKWEQRAKQHSAKLKEAEPKLTEYDRLIEASKTETERAKDAAAAAQQRVTTLTTRAVQAEVKALAASSFADPSDAAAFIDAAKYVNDAGDIDTEAIKADLDELIARKPHLGKDQGVRPPAPNPAQGSSASGPASPGQLTQEDVDRLYRAKNYDAIEKARDEGRLSKLMGA